MDENGKNEDGDGEGLALWRHVARTVTPLDKRKTESLAAATGKASHVMKNKKAGPASDPYKTTGEKASENAEKNSVPGLDRRTEQRLRQGKMAIDATLDLHGMTQTDAYDHLKSFILTGHEKGWRCVLVITGKGSRQSGRTGLDENEKHWFFSKERPGILRRSLPDWLSQSPLKERVLRVVPAKKHHGGAGAFYILIRRKR